MNKGRRDKQPTAKAIPAPTKKVPRRAGVETSAGVGNQTLIIRFNEVDVGGPWCPSNDDAAGIQRILKAVTNFETMRVLEIFTGYPGKDYPMSTLPTRASRDRVEEIGLDDRDNISALRIGNKGRLFGIRKDQFFHALWWDPNHDIWP